MVAPAGLPGQNKTRANKKLLLVLELALVFAGLPLIIYFEPFYIPKIPVLLILSYACFRVLRKDPSFDTGRLWLGKFSGPHPAKLAIKTVAVAAVAVGLVHVLDAGLFLSFPKNKPLLWAAIMILYPLLSVYPQELVYRAFFFHRYKPLFANARTMTAASALAFAFVHIVYDNALAVGLSLAGGYLFALTYRKTGALLPVCLEHALYGAVIFTVGLGRFFYEGR